MFVSGSLVCSYFVCKRQLWFSANNIKMEQDNDLVKQGKLIHETFFNRKRKEISVDDVKFDFVDDKGVHEVKKSSKLLNAHKYQMLYYLKILKNKDIIKVGFLHYPKEKKIVRVELDSEFEKELEVIEKNIFNIVNSDNPPKLVKKPYCKSCSYYELCWV